MVGDRREDIEDAAARGEFATARHHVDAVVGALHQPRDDVVQLVTAVARAQRDRRHVGEPRGERLHGTAHRRRDDERRRAIVLGESPQHVEATPHGLGTRAQPLVGKRLPRGEMHHLHVRDERFQRRPERLRPAARRGDREKDRRPPGVDLAAQEGGKQRRIQTGGSGDVDVAGGRGDGVREGLILFEGAHDPGNCHRTSLVRLADTETPDLGARLLG